MGLVVGMGILRKRSPFATLGIVLMRCGNRTSELSEFFNPRPDIRRYTYYCSRRSLLYFGSPKNTELHEPS
jgi:hypothetical protein